MEYRYAIHMVFHVEHTICMGAKSEDLWQMLDLFLAGLRPLP